MSDQSYASPVDPYWLSSRGVKSVHFLKQDAPPLAYADGRGALYELDDGVLYFNGVPISGGGGGTGDVVGPESVQDNSLAIFDGTTGKLIKGNSGMISASINGRFKLNQITPAGDLRSVSANYINQSTSLGLGAGSDTATDTTAIGFLSGNALTNLADGDTYVGTKSGLNTNTGSENTAVGAYAMEDATEANGNSVLGYFALNKLINGTDNIVLGRNSGDVYAANESRNILINNPGVIGDNDVIRIGNTQTKCFIKGIYGATGLGASQNVIIDANGQLASAASSSGDVSGPVSATNNGMVVYDGTSGKLIKDSTFIYTLNVNNPRIEINGWENLLFTKTNASMFMGYKSGNTYANALTGTANCSFGASSSTLHTGGDSNTAVGSFAQFNRTNQSDNTSVGASSLQNLNAGTGGNTAVGSSALMNLLSGNDNIVIGKNAGSSYTTTESSNILIRNSGTALDSQTIRIGDTNITKTYIGRDFKCNNTNLAVGYTAGNAMNEATANNNVLAGFQAGLSIVNSSNNTYAGYMAARQSTGNYNTVLGSGNLATNSCSGNYNTVIGTGIGSAMTSAAGNIVMGRDCAQQLTTGQNNIIMGYQHGTTLTTGSNNILINANAAVAAEANTLRIAGTTRAFISGISGVTSATAAVACLVSSEGQLCTVSSSREVKENIRDIEDTSFLYALDLKNFEYKDGTCCADTGMKQKHVGVIAEDVELLKPELVIMQQSGVKTVDYHYMFVCALKELQKLNARITALEAAP